MIGPRWNVSKTSRAWGGCLEAPDRRQLLLIHHLTAADLRETNGVPSGQEKRQRREGMTQLPQTHSPVPLLL